MNIINLPGFYLGSIRLSATYLNGPCPDGAALLDEPSEKLVFSNDFSNDFLLASSGDSEGTVPTEKPIGVFIYTTDGNFITSDAWDGANNDKAVSCVF